MHAFTEHYLKFWHFSILLLNASVCYIFPAIEENSHGEFSFGTLGFSALDLFALLLLSGVMFRGAL